jgi:AraC-like DNA-binding protein
MQPERKQNSTGGELTSSPGSQDHLTFIKPSLIARRLFWHLFSIGSRRLLAPEHHDSFEKPGAHLFWVQSGEGELHYEGKRFSLKPGRNVWLVDMRKPRTYAPSAKRPLTMVGFRFGGTGLEFWHEAIRGNENSEVTLNDFGFLKQTLRELRRQVQSTPTGWEWQVHVSITNVMGKLLMARNLLASPDAELPVPIVRVLNAISANPLRDWKAKELAVVGKVSYSALRTLFYNMERGTIHQHIQRARLDHARLLMADKRLTIKDVASQLNFSSEFYFSHFFRHHTGMTPTEFRQHIKG